MKKKKTFNIVDELISDGIGPGGNGGATSWKDLAEKETVILPDTIFSDWSATQTSVTFAEQLIVGETYTVNYNGVIYQTVAFDRLGSAALGNYLGHVLDDMSAGTGEPFYIALTEDLAGTEYLVTGDRSYPITISVSKSTITPIPTEYLPESAKGAFVVAVLSDNGVKFTCDKTVDEVAQAMSEGRIITLQVGMGEMRFPIMQPSVYLYYEGDTVAHAVVFSCVSVNGPDTVFPTVILQADGTVNTSNLM